MMANERNTENLVRNMLRDKGYYDNPNVIIEEQKSQSKRIQSALKNASKQGDGVGKPEFIITFKDKPEDLVIIECKASPLYHESKDKNQSKDYAVDGALSYAKHLKSKFNVTAIGVSGETEREKRISSFLWLKDAYSFIPIQEKVFLSPSELNNIIHLQNNPITEDELIQKAIKYNEELHSYSIPEVERCTFISSILVALQDEVFLRSYIAYTNNQDLVKAIYLACERVLIANGLDSDKTEIILSEYSKFSLNKTLTSTKIKKRKEKYERENTILKDLIEGLSLEILPYIKNNHFDVLGKFYTHFIRYAGSDAKTGLVLTPPHITDLFCDLALLNEDDVIFDPCCGTGGFLVSAMKYMLEKAGNSQEKQKHIKSRQLIGIEKRNDMFSHVCSNMMMRGDGKSHIYSGDCFDSSLKKLVKSKTPNVAFLNPPYQDGNADEQLEFIENALECISKGGICIAICQMSTVVSANKAVIEVKRRLLEKHTLKAVLSMPDDLFHPVAVVTSIIIFEAHTPHHNTKETFFGYFKNDGFEKRKNKGRVDHKNSWDKIKNKWIDAYRNHKNIPGLSVACKVGAEDEWCAEAYMETDYSSISDDDFIKTIKDYLAYQFLNGDMNEVS